MAHTENGTGSDLVNKKVTVPRSLISQQMHLVKTQRISLIEIYTIKKGVKILTKCRCEFVVSERRFRVPSCNF
jgi:hypothetical protein